MSDLYLDPENQVLRRDAKEIPLTQKAFAVLRYLIAHRDQLIAKDDLLEAIWPNTYVTEDGVRHYILELRKALGDDPKAPRYIETVHGRGYRFLGEIEIRKPPKPMTTVPAGFRPAARPSAAPLAGRDTELRRLHAWLDLALQGRRQVGFVSGEPGVGKTALVAAFLDGVAEQAGIRVARGQCSELYGAQEPFMPVLEAVEELCRGADGPYLTGCLRDCAPSWFALLPALRTAGDREEAPRGTQDVYREGMLRELAHFLETVSADRGLVLWLEDLHWADESTLSLLAYLSLRRQPARLLLIGTKHPVEMHADSHPLRKLREELRKRGHYAELRLELLGPEAVTAYMDSQYPGLPPELGRIIHKHTAGCALFMVKMLEHLAALGWIKPLGYRWTLEKELAEINPGVPETLRELIEQQLEQLNDEARRLLEAAAVAGRGFSAATLAAALEQPVEAVEEHCEALARRRQFIRRQGVSLWPDGTCAAQYGFLHALYHQAIYERATPSRRAKLHRVVGEVIERAYGDRSSEVAAELAYHFQHGPDKARTLHYLREAAENALQCHAYAETIRLLRKAIAVLDTQPETRERNRQELVLQARLVTALAATRGYAASQVESVHARVRSLCLALNCCAARADGRCTATRCRMTDALQPVAVQWGLWIFHLTRGDFQQAREVAEDMYALGQRDHEEVFLVAGHSALASCLYFLGEFGAARRHAEAGAALYDPARHGFLTALTGYEQGVLCRAYLANLLWLLGFPDRAVAAAREALAHAEMTLHPGSITLACYHNAVVHQFRREPERVRHYAGKCMALAAEHNFAILLNLATLLDGWAAVKQGDEAQGIAEMCGGLAAFATTEARFLRSWNMARLGDAYAQLGKYAAALDALDEALQLSEAMGERTFAAELHRLKGDWLLRQGGPEAAPAAEASLTRALAVARAQGAKAWELRAATSLARLWLDQGRRDEARTLLVPVYEGFTEGFDTADLREAADLLSTLAP
jgi:DNA-binding winged helix-turn-helix (wHTH) protein/predicted ATPase